MRTLLTHCGLQRHHPADVSNFTGTDQEYVDRLFVSGIQRAGGLRVARLLTENRE
jgi:hypothetical protein